MAPETMLRRNRNRRRHRGALLVEAALAVGIAVSLVALGFSITREMQLRADSALLAAEKRSVMLASRNLVREQRIDLIERMFDEALSGGGEAAIAIPLSDLRDAGYLATALDPGGVIDRLHGQDYVLMARAVFQDDTGTPATTLSALDMDPGGTGAIDPALIDGDIQNGEIGIEAVLFTRNGTPIPAGALSRAIEQTELLNAGALFANDGTARGALGALSFDVTGFDDLLGFQVPAPGRFASPISIGSLGVLGDEGMAGQDLADAFRRCTDIDVTTQAFRDCLAAPSNVVWTDIRIENFDSTGDGLPDTFPAIDGLTRIRCANPSGAAAAADPDILLIDCATTNISGVLDVDGPAITLDGRTIAEVRNVAGNDEIVLAGNRQVINLPDGSERDLTEAVFSTRIVAAGQTIPKPVCPANALTGEPMEPRAIAHVAAFSDPWGRPVSGVWANAESTGSDWRVRIRYVVSDDFCDSSFADPIPASALPLDGSGFVSGTRQPTLPQCAAGNNSADVYELDLPAYGASSVSIRCF